MSKTACFFFTIHGRRNLPLESFGAHEGSCAKWLASLVGLAAVRSACKGERALGASPTSTHWALNCTERFLVNATLFITTLVCCINSTVDRRVSQLEQQSLLLQRR